MINITNNNIVDIAMDNTSIERAYIGSTLVWEKNTTPEFITVEYIENTSNAYINTGRNPFNGLKFDACFSISTLDRNNYLIGRRAKNNAINTATNYMAGIFVDTNNNIGVGYNRTDVRYTNHTVQANAKYHISGAFKNFDVTVGDETFNVTNGASWLAGISNSSLYLFNIRQPTLSDNNAMLGKIYYFKIYNTSDVLLLDFEPRYQTSTGLYGLYDVVNNVFYTSPNGTLFTGPSVT